jgi:putative FmdB family regulatory protein
MLCVYELVLHEARGLSLMPFYEYVCKQCGHRFERFQRMSDDPVKTCPECEGEVVRVVQPVGVIFKGSGFYVTDNRGKSSTAPGSSSSKPSNGSSGDGNGKEEKVSSETKDKTEKSASTTSK